MKKIFDRITGKKKTNTPKDFEWEKFQKMAKRQFESLKEKGLSIPVMTI